jgi:triacylglycerol lipase
MGPNLNPEVVSKTAAMMKPLVASAPLNGIKLTADLSYGSDPLQKIDIYQPLKTRRAPIVVFVHGGGFSGGDKNSYGPIYGNVTAYLARHGMLAVNADYRLAPQAVWPAQAEDVGLVIAWLKANGARYGGDPGRIFVIGHSAGATDVASYVRDDRLHPKEGPGVVGAILISGVYRATSLRPSDRPYFGADESQYEARMPAAHIGESKLPLFLVTAEFDPIFLAPDTYDLAARVCARDGKCPRFAWLKGHNHLSETMSIGSKDDGLGRQLVDFIRATK